MSSVSEQLDNEDISKPEPAVAPEDDKRVKLEELAAKLGNATSLEEMDDVAAETLFGVEFSQLAKAISADPNFEPPETAASESPFEGTTELSLLDEPETTEASSPDPTPAVETPAESTPPVAPATAKPAPPTRPTMPPPGTPRPDIDSSAMRRLEMVRSLNGKPPTSAEAPTPPPQATTEEIVLGDSTPTPPANGEEPERIEEQFGTSMTANLKALSMQTVQTMQQAEAEEEQKKGGLFSRFRRSQRN